MLAAPTVDEDMDDPDLPPGMAGLIESRRIFSCVAITSTSAAAGPLVEADELRTEALLKMQKQEKEEKGKYRNISSPFDAVNWNFVGPAPIPLGQTTTTRVPVSGRTIAIAVHPTNADIVYVGTAQGGLYKSTNGGTNWTRLFDFQLESLAIGAITIDPTDSSNDLCRYGRAEPLGRQLCR